MIDPVEVGCLGYTGYGSGYAIAKGFNFNNEKFCSICHLRNECWEKHKATAKRVIPEVVKAFEKMAEVISGPALVQRWMDKNKYPDPYTMNLAVNFKDGTEQNKPGTYISEIEKALAASKERKDDP